MACSICHKAEAAPNRKSCESCLAKKRKITADHNARLDAQGICRCGKAPIVEGKRACEACLVRRLNYTLDFQRRQREKGLCQCGKRPPTPGKRLCEECRVSGIKRSKRFFQKNIDAGMCYTCGKVPSIDGSSRCAQCKQKHRDSNYRHAYQVEGGVIAALIEKQNHQCAMCHDPLGDRYHVDHDHVTNAVRGVLCSGCNTFAGKYEKRIDNLPHINEYLFKDRPPCPANPPSPVNPPSTPSLPSEPTPAPPRAPTPT